MSDLDKYIFVIEDHPLYRHALQIELSAIFPDDEIMTFATTEECLWRNIPASITRLLIVDFHLRGLSGSSAIYALRQRYPDIPLMVLSASEDRQEADAALRAGAGAFVSKTLGIMQMRAVLARAANGNITKGEWHLPTEVGSALTASAFPSLSERQREILFMVCNGLSNKEIALRLALAEVTVKMHLTRAFRALGVVNRSQAICAVHSLAIELAVGQPAGADAARISERKRFALCDADTEFLATVAHEKAHVSD